MSGAEVRFVGFNRISLIINNCSSIAHPSRVGVDFFYFLDCRIPAFCFSRFCLCLGHYYAPASIGIHITFLPPWVLCAMLFTDKRMDKVGFLVVLPVEKIIFHSGSWIVQSISFPDSFF